MMGTGIMERIRHEGRISGSRPPFAVGDTVRVHVRVKEGDKERLQVFSGVVIARRGGGVEERFTVRRVSHGVGVERIFPLHSPHVVRIEVERPGRVRRAKLYYLRRRSAKGARVREREATTAEGGSGTIAGV